MLVGMNAKQKYRLQRKLESALVDVVKAMAFFHEAGLVLNVSNLRLAAEVADLLAARVSEAGLSAPPAEADFGPASVGMLVEVVKRRRKETRARRRRKANAGVRGTG
jgi:hypothetical protein